MNKSRAGIFLAGLIGLFVLAGCSSGSSNVDAVDYAPEENREPFNAIATGSTGEGDVLVELSPRGVKDGKLEVDIAVNTHSVNLNQFALKEITTLEFNGKRLKPVSAPGLAGHHSSGTIVFDVGEDVSSYAITIEGIPDSQNRTFKWGES